MAKYLKYPIVHKEWPKIRNMRPATTARFMMDPRPHSKLSTSRS
jgi:hypothetical protein